MEQQIDRWKDKGERERRERQRRERKKKDTEKEREREREKQKREETEKANEKESDKERETERERERQKEKMRKRKGKGKRKITMVLIFGNSPPLASPALLVKCLCSNSYDISKQVDTSNRENERECSHPQPASLAQSALCSITSQHPAPENCWNQTSNKTTKTCSLA